MCINRQKSQSSTENNSTQIDKRTAAQDSGIAIATDGNVVIDQIPEELLNFTAGIAQGASDLVEKSINLVGSKVDKVLALSPQSVDANTRAKAIDPVALVLVLGVSAFLLLRK